MAYGVQKKFYCYELQGICYRTFEGMRRRKRLTDITIRVRGRRSVRAHRLIVMAAIPYFRNRWNENVFELLDLDPEEVRCLIDYAYTSRVHIDTSNVKAVWQAANRLGVDEVQHACCDFLSDCLVIDTALYIRRLAFQFNCSSVFEEAERIISENFNAISYTDNFLNYDRICFEELIGKDDLNVVEEEEVLEAVLRWVNHSPHDRVNGLPEFLRKIRMPLIDPLYLENILDTEVLIRGSPICQNIVRDSLYPEMGKAGCSSFYPQPRLKKEPEKRIPCIYRLESRETYAVQRYDLLQRKWTTKRNIATCVKTGSVVYFEDMIYIFTLQVIEYYPKTHSFGLMASMPTSRHSFDATVCRNRIFICGGILSSREPTSVVECLDPKFNTWSTVKSMPTARGKLSAVTLGDCIFAIGGTVDLKSPIDTVEKYDSNCNTWISVSPMGLKRHSAGAATLDDKIYVCGGVSLDYTSCERYDPTPDHWVLIKHLISVREDLGLLPFKQELYAIGGVDIHTVDVYDPRSDTWRILDREESGICSLGTVVAEAVEKLAEDEEHEVFYEKTL